MENRNADGVEKAMGVPQLCQKGCGFFQNGGGLYCSKCAKEVAQQEEKLRATERATEASASSIAASLQAGSSSLEVAPVKEPGAPAAFVPVVQPCSPAEASVPVESTSAPAAQESSVPLPNPNRCFQCKKRTGLTGFKCRCNNVFCGSHRLAECHDCPFDYKTLQRAQLADANPVVKAAKVQKL